jgi:hypothetical protein
MKKLSSDYISENSGARGTAFPLPAPGSAPKPLPMVVDAPQLKKLLGLTNVNYSETNHTLAIVDSTLS